MPLSTSLFTRIVYPNSTIKIELYNESIPYGYAKYLRVYYKCTDERDVLVGNNMRECSRGNWIGLVPRCALNNLNQTKLSNVKVTDYKVGDTSIIKNNQKYHEDKPMNVLIFYDDSLQLNPNGSFQVPLMNQPQDCLRWSLSPKQIWTLNLDRKTLVHYVRLKLYGNHIEDLYLNSEIGIELSLTNISLHDTNDQSKQIDSLPMEIKCIDTIPKESQFSAYHQKYSANYLVLDFLCEIEDKEKTLFEFLFAEDYDIDELLVSVIEVRFEMYNVLHIDNEQNIDLEFKQKIFVISLCELHLYSFEPDCGTPDLPVTAIVQRDFNFIEDDGHVRKSYKYICPYNQQIKGNPDIECEPYGKWKEPFPTCEQSNPCGLLKNLTFKPGFLIDVKYETTMINKKYKDVIVPNGKYANIICIPLNNDINNNNNYSLDNGTSFIYNYNFNETNKSQKMILSTPKPKQQDVIQIKCVNGKWIGMESIDCITHRSLFESNIFSMKNISRNAIDKIQVISLLPDQMIKILFILFIFLLLIIICLLIYLIIYRQRVSKQKKNNSKECNPNNLADLNMATDLYSSQAIMPSAGAGAILPTFQFDTYRNDYYNSIDDFYERITLEERRDSNHLYHTIPNSNNINNLISINNNKNNNNNRNTISNLQSHYSDLSLYPTTSSKLSSSSIRGNHNHSNNSSNDNNNYKEQTLNLDIGEEKYNSIYGLDDGSATTGIAETTTIAESHDYKCQEDVIKQNNNQKNNGTTLTNNVTPTISITEDSTNDNNDGQSLIVQYNSLSRSSSGYLRENSIYEA